MRIGSDCAIDGRKTPVASAAALEADPAKTLRRMILICFLRMAYVFLAVCSQTDALAVATLRHSVELRELARAICEGLDCLACMTAIFAYFSDLCMRGNAPTGHFHGHGAPRRCVSGST